VSNFDPETPRTDSAPTPTPRSLWLPAVLAASGRRVRCASLIVAMTLRSPHVNPTVLLDDAVHDLRRGVRVGHVETDGLSCWFPLHFPNLDGDVLSGVCSDVRDVYDPALSGESSRDRRPDAGSGPGDQTNLATNSVHA